MGKREAPCGAPLLSLALAFWLSLLGRSDARAQAGSVDHERFMGTWQIMTVKNLKTGEIDSIFKRRLLWTQYTRSHWTYVYADTGRRGPTSAELARLSPEERRKTNYAKMWNDAGQWRFWGSGGTYWLDGDRMFYTNLISIEPSQVHLGGVEKVIFVNDTAYAYNTMPDRDGVVREYLHRRLDRGGRLDAPRTATTPAELLIGNWQVMTQRNLTTGAVDNVALLRANWFHVTERHWTYVWMTKDRKNLPPPDLAHLPAAEQNRERYAKIWNDRDQPVFWASGGTYRIEGNRFVVESRVMSIEPWMVGVQGLEPIVKLDREAYAYQAPPDSTGVVRETTHRRIDW